MGKIKEKETRKDWKKNRKKVLLFCDPWFRPKSTIYESNFYFLCHGPFKGSYVLDNLSNVLEIQNTPHLFGRI